MVFVSSRLTKASTSWAFHAANISRAIWRLSCPAMVSSLCSIDSTESLELRLRLLQPVRHSHLAVHRRRGGEVLLRLLTLASAPVELAEAEVAVGDKGPHAQCLGQSQGLLVVGCGLLDIRGVDVGIDNPKLVQRERLVGTLLQLPGQVERLARVLPGLLAVSR